MGLSSPRVGPEKVYLRARLGGKIQEVTPVIGLYCAEECVLKSVEPGKANKALWIDAVAPTPSEVEMLNREFNLDLQDVADCLDPNERSRVEIDENYDLLLLRTILTEDKEDKISTMPIGIFVTSDKVITVRLGSTFRNEEITSDLRRRPRLDTKEDLLLTIVRRINRDFERRVRTMDRTITDVQEKILAANKPEAVREAFMLSNGLILLNTALLANLNAFSMLARAKHIQLTKERMDIAEDLENDMGQLYEMTTIYREIMSNTLDAFESAVANKLGIIMKTLATVSLILVLPLLISSLFSMNVGLPFGDKENPINFWIVIGISAAGVASLWAFFRVKGIL